MKSMKGFKFLGANRGLNIRISDNSQHIYNSTNHRNKSNERYDR